MSSTELSRSAKSGEDSQPDGAWGVGARGPGKTSKLLGLSRFRTRETRDEQENEIPLEVGELTTVTGYPDSEIEGMKANSVVCLRL